MASRVKQNAPTTASGQSARSKPSTRQGLPTIPVGATPDKARIHWKKTAIRTLGIPRLPLIVEEEHRRHTAARIEEEERKARHEYEKVLLQLPRVNASYADSTDYFSEFLQGDKIRDAETAELEQFLRFCDVHGDFEKRRKLYYALCARQLLKQKQIDLLIADTKSYEAASELADKLLSHGSETEASDSAAVSQTIFDELVKNFAEKSFALCSLKSQELHVRATRYADMRSTAVTETGGSDSTMWEIRREKIFIAVLDLRLSKCLTVSNKDSRKTRLK